MIIIIRCNDPGFGLRFVNLIAFIIVTKNLAFASAQSCKQVSIRRGGYARIIYAVHAVSSQDAERAPRYTDPTVSSYLPASRPALLVVLLPQLAVAPHPSSPASSLLSIYRQRVYVHNQRGPGKQSQSARHKLMSTSSFRAVWAPKQIEQSKLYEP